MEHHLYLGQMAHIFTHSNLSYNERAFSLFICVVKTLVLLKSLLVVHYVISFQDLHFDVMDELLTLQIQNNLVITLLLALDLTLLSLIDYSTVLLMSDNHK